MLLQAGADYRKIYTSAMYNDFNAVHICASKSKSACIEVLWKYGADLNIKTGDGLLPRTLTPDNSCRELILRLEGKHLQTFHSRRDPSVQLLSAGFVY